MTNRISASSIITFLPYLSASRPVMGLAIKAPRLVHDVIKDLSMLSNGRPKSLLIETRVDEITPVLESSQLGL